MSEASRTRWSTIALDEIKLRKTSIVLRWLPDARTGLAPAGVAGMFGAYQLRGIPLLHHFEAVCHLRLPRRLPSSASSAKSRAAKCPRQSGASCCQPTGIPNTKTSPSFPTFCLLPNRLLINFCDITHSTGLSSFVECSMPYEKRERWIELCKQAETEQDPKKLMELVTEINRLLQEEENRRREMRG